MKDNRKKYPVDFRDVYFDGEYLWGSARQFNGLIRIKMSTWEVEYIAQFPDDNVLYELHSAVFEDKNKLFFIPAIGNQIDIYDKENERFECVKISCQHMKWNFLSSFVTDNQIVSLPFESDAIIVYNLLNGTQTYIGEFDKREAEGNFFRQSVAIRDDILYAVSLSHDGICEIDIKNRNVKWKNMDEHNNRFSTLLDDGKYFWMAGEKKNLIVRWDVSTGEVKKFDDFPSDYSCSNEGKIPFCDLIDCGDRILAVAIRANMSIWIDKKNGTIEECKALNQSNIPNIDYFNTEQYRFAKKIDEDKVLIMSCRDKAIVIFSISQDKVIFRKQVRLTFEVWEDILVAWYSHSKVMQEGNYVAQEGLFSLEEYINYLCDH